jgi:hypothetical protein
VEWQGKQYGLSFNSSGENKKWKCTQRTRPRMLEQGNNRISSHLFGMKIAEVLRKENAEENGIHE